MAAVVSGHQHEGGVHTTDNGTHFVVMESPMLAEPGHPGPYAVVEARGDALAFVGYGRGRKSNLFKTEGAEGGAEDEKDAEAAIPPATDPLVRELPLRPRTTAGAGA